MSNQPDEILVQLDELDGRIDRLRALFEQYFVGIERTEPYVQKKDVERRIQLLRKIQIRNTALRFRFQTLVQKYTTYLTYWQRISRQIEEGTFKRDVARVQRYGKAARRPSDDEEIIETISADELESLDQVEDLRQILGALDAPDAATVSAQPRRSNPPDKPKPAPQERMREEIDLGALASERPPAAAASTAPAPKPATVPTPERVPGPSAAVDAPTETKFRVPGPATSMPSTANATAPGNPARGAVPLPLPAGASSVAGASSATSPGRFVPPSPAAAPNAKRPGISPFGGPVAKPHAKGDASGPPKKKSSGKMRAMKAAHPIPPAEAHPQTRDNTAGRPAPPAGGGSDRELRDLYERYRDARRKIGEDDVGYEAIARQVQDTLPRLEKKYPGQDVSIDVTVKDGKTILQPVVRNKK